MVGSGHLDPTATSARPHLEGELHRGKTLKEEVFEMIFAITIVLTNNTQVTEYLRYKKSSW